MKKIKLSSRSKSSGQGMVIVIILLAVVGAGLWYLYSNKATTDREAREFAREAIKHITVDHDLKYFSDHLGPQARLDNPPSQQQFIIQRLIIFLRAERLFYGAPELSGAASHVTACDFPSRQSLADRQPLIFGPTDAIDHVGGRLFAAANPSCGGSILPVGCARPKAARANRGKFATTFPASRGASSIHFG